MNAGNGVKEENPGEGARSPPLHLDYDSFPLHRYTPNFTAPGDGGEPSRRASRNGKIETRSDLKRRPRSTCLRSSPILRPPPNADSRVFERETFESLWLRASRRARNLCKDNPDPRGEKSRRGHPYPLRVPAGVQPAGEKTETVPPIVAGWAGRSLLRLLAPGRNRTGGGHRTGSRTNRVKLRFRGIVRAGKQPLLKGRGRSPGRQRWRHRGQEEHRVKRSLRPMPDHRA